MLSISGAEPCRGATVDANVLDAGPAFPVKLGRFCLEFSLGAALGTNSLSNIWWMFRFSGYKVGVLPGLVPAKSRFYRNIRALRRVESRVALWNAGDPFWRDACIG